MKTYNILAAIANKGSIQVLGSRPYISVNANIPQNGIFYQACTHLGYIHWFDDKGEAEDLTVKFHKDQRIVRLNTVAGLQRLIAQHRKPNVR